MKVDKNLISSCVNQASCSNGKYTSFESGKYCRAFQNSSRFLNEKHSRNE